MLAPPLLRVTSVLLGASMRWSTGPVLAQLPLPLVSSQTLTATPVVGTTGELATVGAVGQFLQGDIAATLDGLRASEVDRAGLPQRLRRLTGAPAVDQGAEAGYAKPSILPVLQQRPSTR